MSKESMFAHYGVRDNGTRLRETKQVGVVHASAIMQRCTET
jgi:hypothetical protein